MLRNLLLTFIVLIIVLLAAVLIVVPAYVAVTHTSVVPSTPASPASVGAAADSALAHAQDLLNSVNALTAVMGVVLTVFGGVTALLGFLGFSTIRDAREKLTESTQAMDKFKAESGQAIEKLKDEHAKATAELKAENDRLKDEHDKAIGKIMKDAHDTRTALIYLGMGDRLIEKEPGEAVKIYRKVNELLPHDAQVNYVLGRIYSGVGYYEDAITSFDAALAAQPDNLAQVLKEQGLTYRRRGDALGSSSGSTTGNADYDRAIDCLNRSIALRPDDDDAFGIVGGLYRRKQEYDQALDYYQRAFLLNNRSSYALGNIASLLWYKGKTDEARKYFILTEATAEVRLMNGLPESYWDYYDRALAQLVLGKVQEARKTYESAIKLTPGKVQLSSVLDNLYLLDRAQDQIAGLRDIIKLLEEARARAH
jgi:tetratricopeptide (TPR) repeat protein